MTHYTPGRFVWHELLTPDLEKSKSFYQQLLGWSVDLMPMGDTQYPLIKTGETPIGGFLTLDHVGPNVPPHWLGYVSVPNVDEAVAASKSAGGAVLHGPVDEGPGRLAVLADPLGGVVSAWKAVDGDPPEVTAPVYGAFCWDELNTPTPEKVKTYYEKVFAWTQAPGPVQNITVLKRGEKLAAGLHRVPNRNQSAWLSHLLVQNLSDTRSRVATLGGRILIEQIDVPKIGKYAVIADNVGAHVSIFESA